MDFRKKVAKGIIWSATQNWGRLVIVFFVLLVLSRLLEPEAFGLMALGTVFVAFAKIFLDQGFRIAIVQRAELESEHLDTAFWTAILTAGLLVAGGITTSGLVAGLFGQPQMAPILSWLSFGFLFAALSSNQEALLQRKLAFKSLAARSIVAEVGGGIAGVILALLGFGVWSLVAQSLTSEITGAVVLWRVSDWRPGLRFSKKHFKELFTFGVNIVGTRFLNFFNRRSDDLLIGYFLGPTALGYYTIAYRLLLMITRLLLNVINAVALPAFSRLQHEPERMRQAFRTATQYSSLIAFPAFLGISAVASELVPALHGPQWGPSIPVLQVLGLSGILQALFFFNNPVIIAAGKPAWQLVLTTVQAIASVIVFAVAVQWGIVAVAAGFVLRGYLTSPVSLWMLYKLIGIKPVVFLYQSIRPLAGSLAMVLAVLGARQIFEDFLSLYPLLAVSMGLGAVVYAATIVLIAPELSRQVLDFIYLFSPRRKRSSRMSRSRLSPVNVRANLKLWLKRSPLLGPISRAIRQAFRLVLDGGRIFVGNRNAKTFGRWRDYFAAQPIAGYIGWLGYDNLGDEAMYLSFKKLFPRFQIIVSNDVHPIELILYRHLVKRRKFYTLVFLGGGTLINARRYLDALQSARLRNKQLIVFGTGVRDPSFWAEHYPQVDYFREMANWIAVLQKAVFLSVRGPQSASILESYGLPKPRIIGDPALSICIPRPADSPGSHTIALNLGCSGPMWGSQKILHEVIGRLSQQLLERGWQVEFLPMHPADLRLGQRIIRAFDLPQVSVWREFRNVHKTLARIRTYDLVVGQRLHSAILACGCGVPAISLEYRPKCGDFMESIGMQKFAVRTDVVDVDKILALMDEINTNYIDHCQQLNSNCDHLRRLQRQAAEEALSLSAVGVGPFSLTKRIWPKMETTKNL